MLGVMKGFHFGLCAHAHATSAPLSSAATRSITPSQSQVESGGKGAASDTMGVSPSNPTPIHTRSHRPYRLPKRRDVRDRSIDSDASSMIDDTARSP